MLLRLEHSWGLAPMSVQEIMLCAAKTMLQKVKLIIYY